MAKWLSDLKVESIFYFKSKDKISSGFYEKLDNLIGGSNCQRLKDNKVIKIAYNAVVIPC